MIAPDANSAAPFQLLLITNSSATAAHAIASGVDLVFVDLEITGKHERQKGRSTVVSGHTYDDVGRVRAVVPRGKLLVRINPWDGQSPREVEEVISRGADHIMLPMFRGPAELESLVRAVDGRCAVIGLLETVEAAGGARDVAAVAGVSRIHIGLNDLHLAMRCRFMFELLTDGTVERVATALREGSMPFGIGGLARVGEGLVPAELLVAEHVALGSTGAILSRTFHRSDAPDGFLTSGGVLAAEIGKLRSAVNHCHALPRPALDALRADAHARIRRVVETT